MPSLLNVIVPFIMPIYNCSYISIAYINNPVLVFHRTTEYLELEKSSGDHSTPLPRQSHTGTYPGGF